MPFKGIFVSAKKVLICSDALAEKLTLKALIVNQHEISPSDVNA